MIAVKPMNMLALVNEEAMFPRVSSNFAILSSLVMSDFSVSWRIASIIPGECLFLQALFYTELH